MNAAYDSIKQGLIEALDVAKNRQTTARIHEVVAMLPDVAEIRKKTHLSQTDFAKSLGISKGTLLNWEQKRRTPSGPAKILLALIDKNPSLVQDYLK